MSMIIYINMDKNKVISVSSPKLFNLGNQNDGPVMEAEYHYLYQ